ncbi:MAG TPA: hypothetical protein VFF28_01620 [Candidatus Nanoarchaeia archaeon]|nr:hypothetical protein [Candidatus Nanoarchaeia archaeon]
MNIPDRSIKRIAAVLILLSAVGYIAERHALLPWQGQERAYRNIGELEAEVRLFYQHPSPEKMNRVKARIYSAMRSAAYLGATPDEQREILEKALYYSFMVRSVIGANAELRPGQESIDTCIMEINNTIEQTISH